MNYNHPVWPSPRARLVAIKLGLDTKKPEDGSRKIKLTHAEAIKRLAHLANKTVEDFLKMKREEAFIAIGSYKYIGNTIVSLDPLRRTRYQNGFYL
jgi:hypothetical protein